MTCRDLDLYNHSTYNIFSQLGIDLRDKKIIHIGAHDGLEAGIYKHMGVIRADFIECNKFIFPKLLERLEDYPNYHAHFIALSDKDNNYKTYYSYRNITDGASGFYLPDKMFDHIKDCPLTGDQWEVGCMTYDTYSEDKALPTDYALLNIDVQGEELNILKSAKSLLNQKTLEWIYCETSNFSCYLNGPLEKDITNYLAQFGFQKIGFRKDWGDESEQHGDTIYKRNEHI